MSSFLVALGMALFAGGVVWEHVAPHAIAKFCVIIGGAILVIDALQSILA